MHLRFFANQFFSKTEISRICENEFKSILKSSFPPKNCVKYFLWLSRKNNQVVGTWRWSDRFGFGTSKSIWRIPALCSCDWCQNIKMFHSTVPTISNEYCFLSLARMKRVNKNPEEKTAIIDCFSSSSVSARKQKTLVSFFASCLEKTTVWFPFDYRVCFCVLNSLKWLSCASKGFLWWTNKKGKDYNLQHTTIRTWNVRVRHFQFSLLAAADNTCNRSSPLLIFFDNTSL